MKAIILFVLVSICTIGNVGAQTELLNNNDLETPASYWTRTGNFFYNNYFASSGNYHSYNTYAYVATTATSGLAIDNAVGNLTQASVYVPSTTTTLTMGFWTYITTTETAAIAYDSLRVTISNGSWIATYDLSNIHATSGHVYRTFSVSGSYYAGTYITVNFRAKTDFSNPTQFRVDDISLIATVPPCTPPSITSNPTSVTVTPPSGTSFSVSASGSSLLYQWEMSTDGGSSFSSVPASSPYSGSTSSTLNISSTTSAMNNYRYRCRVSSSCTSAIATSTAAILTTTCPAPTITTDPTSVTVSPPASANFSVSASGTGLGYQWQYSTDGGSTWSSVPTGSPYSGGTTATLSISATSASMNNYRFRCVVSSSCSSTTVTSLAAILTTSCPSPSITTNPTSTTVTPPAAATFSVVASGSSLSYQWQFSTDAGVSWISVPSSSPYSGTTTAVLSISPTSSSMNGYQYKCYITSTCTTVTATSTAGVLTTGSGCPPPVITMNPVNVTVAPPSGTSFSMTATGSSLIYLWQMSTDGGVSWISVPSSSPYSGVNTPTLSISSTTTSMNNYQYKCYVSSSCTSSTATTLPAVLTTTTTGCPPPTVTTHPASVSVAAPAGTSFTVAATGASLVYQWQISTDGGTTYTSVPTSTPYSGTTSVSLSISSTTTAMNTYQYRCIVSSSCTTVTATSSSATITVTTGSSTLPDLTISFPGTDNGNPCPSQSLNVNYRVDNGSPVVVSNPSLSKLYLSDNTVFDVFLDAPLNDDIVPSIAGTGHVVRTVPVTIPATATLGPKFILILVDVLDSVAELDNSNNLSFIPVTIVDCPISVKDLPAEAIHDFIVVPNPSKGEVTVFLESRLYSNEHSELAVLNSLGQKVYFKKLNKSNQYSFDLSDMPDGMYFVQLRNDIGNTTKKLMLIR